ncbi:HyaD/HybD family hydrogenase maturation endopeptidase [Granulosicoccaceae sp. 1_MG-2023]|nr:HyaD/HybD family hydrogenase maturation endopeptidase [Granulosicoccaceae sp. 1_MG-2023]
MSEQPDTTTPTRVLILGIGNVLWADEGFGVRTVEALNARYRFGDNVKLMDGGTQGIYLIQHVQEADILLVFDAIDYGLAPGTMKLIKDDQVPAFMGAKKMSLHQTGFQEVLSTSMLTGHYPQHLLLVGVQPVELEDYGGSLREPVKAQIGPAIDAALSWLAEFGIHAEERSEPLSPDEAISAPQIALDEYETGRPDETVACRLGDDRVLADEAFAFDPKPSLLGEDGLSVNVDNRKPGL